jgi:hypothetical protein
VEFLVYITCDETIHILRCHLFIVTEPFDALTCQVISVQHLLLTLLQLVIVFYTCELFPVAYIHIFIGQINDEDKNNGQINRNINGEGVD